MKKNRPLRNAVKKNTLHRIQRVPNTHYLVVLFTGAVLQHSGVSPLPTRRRPLSEVSRAYDPSDREIFRALPYHLASRTLVGDEHSLVWRVVHRQSRPGREEAVTATITHKHITVVNFIKKSCGDNGDKSIKRGFRPLVYIKIIGIFLIPFYVIDAKGQATDLLNFKPVPWSRSAQCKNCSSEPEVTTTGRSSTLVCRLVRVAFALKMMRLIFFRCSDGTFVQEVRGCVHRYVTSVVPRYRNIINQASFDQSPNRAAIRCRVQTSHVEIRLAKSLHVRPGNQARPKAYTRVQVVHTARTRDIRRYSFTLVQAVHQSTRTCDVRRDKLTPDATSCDSGTTSMWSSQRPKTISPRCLHSRGSQERIDHNDNCSVLDFCLCRLSIEAVSIQILGILASRFTTHYPPRAAASDRSGGLMNEWILFAYKTKNLQGLHLFMSPPLRSLAAARGGY
ncbi:unnamed protein product [Trichogramma brassicae]|uniref:Uncharacterized protein n=1 Tax=Trichogramma brassicae TaxID=86971 RepID=A0A6H5J1U4_9HYME|nr:unnamed protein product [Trichogramma brassicae]